MMKTPTSFLFTNHLVNETSPYLLQHAHNPVDWYPWNDQALKRSKKEDKPILVSIGYAACHWCHVMEHESFNDVDVAKIMNDNFICIKVDREERPDIDHIYMDAIQIMIGSGGWPLNVFLTPELKPFYGGTYFPTIPKYNRPSWTQVLNNISSIFKEKRNEIEEQADKLVKYIETLDSKFISNDFNSGENLLFNKELLDDFFTKTKEIFDVQDGGFGSAPKFPSSMAIRFLLRYFYFTNRTEAIQHAELSLEKMIMGGIYDQLGGGFSRYSTDKKWLVPHFEKMLYDNALLVSTLAEAYQLTKKEIYQETIQETLKYIQKELTNDEGGFYSSQDADSEGEEGKYYVWNKNEIDELLGEDSQIFCEYYDVNEQGNWEGMTILNRKKSFEKYAREHHLEVIFLKQKMEDCRKILLQHRNKRVKPNLDDKIILGWNALMCSGYAKAYQAFGNHKWKLIAEKNIQFLLDKFRVRNSGFDFFHTYKDGNVKYTAFLDDYAFLIEALLNVYEISFNENLLETAYSLTEHVITNFFDEKKQVFFYTSIRQDDILLRKNDLYDNALPSGNSTMFDNLLRLSVIFEKNSYRDKAIVMIKNILPIIKIFPTSFSKWINAMSNIINSFKEIAIVGDEYNQFALKINELFIPDKIIMAYSGNRENKYPLLHAKDKNSETLIFVCKNYSCNKPVKTLKEFKKLMNFL